jgi:rhomboid family GlyGly-CTERM serine protease
MPNSLRKSAVPWAAGLFLLFMSLASWPGIEDALSYQRLAIASGQYWRVFTGHFVHLNLAHAFMNGTGTLMLAVFLRQELPLRDWWSVLLLAPLVISLGLWLKQPGLLAYVGFSGVLHGLLYVGVLRLIPAAPVFGGTVLLLLVGRQVWEQTGSYDPNYLRSVIHGRVMPDAHLFGALTGLVLGSWSLWRDRLPKSPGTGYSPGTGQSPDA